MSVFVPFEIVEDPPGSGEYRLTKATGTFILTPGQLVTFTEVAEHAPDLSQQDQERLTAELNAAARRVAPFLDTPEATADQLVEANGILIRAVDRHGAVASWVASVSTGPYSESYRSSASSSSILTADDVAALLALRPSDPSAGLPAGHFHSRPSYGRLFREPRW